MLLALSSGFERSATAVTIRTQVSDIMAATGGMMQQPAGRVFEFGPFHYDAVQRLLFRGSEVVPLMPKAVDTLQVLLEHRGRVVEKGELMKAVWPDTVVEEVGLARNISLLRKALEEGSEGNYIDTIPRRGYRFVAAVVETGQNRDSAEPPAAARIPGRTGIKKRALVALALAALAGGVVYWQFYSPSKYLTVKAGAPGLAVVPFECLSPEIYRAGLAQGFSELLVADLAKVGGVSVLSPSTVRRYAWVRISMSLMARLLGLEVLVEGTVQKSGERLRITSQLVDVHTGKLIWADSYDYPLAEWDRAQAGAAREIAAEIGVHLLIQSTFPRAVRREH